MSLFTTTTSTNRVVEQSNTYTFETEPAQQVSTVRAVEEGSSFTIGERVITTQWRVSAHFAKRYRYVGMSGNNIDNLAEAIANAYTVNMPRYALGFYVDTNKGIAVYKFMPVEGSGVPTRCAAVTPTHVDGPIWNIEVDVNATIEAYYDTAPSSSDIKGLFASIANFPSGL